MAFFNTAERFDPLVPSPAALKGIFFRISKHAGFAALPFPFAVQHLSACVVAILDSWNTPPPLTWRRGLYVHLLTPAVFGPSATKTVFPRAARIFPFLVLCSVSPPGTLYLSPLAIPSPAEVNRSYNCDRFVLIPSFWLLSITARTSLEACGVTPVL